MDIDNITEIIEFQYVTKRKIKFPSFVATVKNKEDFRKAAQICIDEDYDPQSYVSALYEHYDSGNLEFYSRLLISNRCKEIYGECITNSALTIEDVFDTNKAYLRAQIENNSRSVEDVLIDDMIPLQAWFRVLVTKDPIEEVEHKYLATARKEYSYYKADIDALCVKFNLSNRRFL